ncbi:MAG: EAL domain-containing protein [Vibrio sp.]
MLETIYDLSHQSISILDAQGCIRSSNLTLQELVYDPNFDQNEPIWVFPGWANPSKIKVEQSFIEAKHKGVVRFEAELIHSNIGPAIFDLTIRKLPENNTMDEQYLLEARDITARKLTERRLIENEANFRSYYELQPVVMITLDEFDRIQAVNQFTSELLGYNQNQLLGRKLQDFYVNPSELTARERLLQPQRKKNSNKRVVVERREVQYFAADQQKLWIRENIRQVVETNQLLIVAEDITETYLLSEKLEYQAHHDTLTNLYSRHHFEQELIQAIHEVKENIRAHALFYLDLDQFKLINDTVGHEAGDSAIVYSAHLLSKITPPTGTLARIGGDEFAILLRDCEEDCIRDFAKEILKAFSQGKFIWQGIHLNLNCSIGIRKIDASTKSPQMVHAQADTACNMAKEEGRNRAHIYSLDDESFRRREMEMECVNQVYDALAHGRVDLYAQPITDISPTPSTKMHFEILVRLRDKENALMSPGIFMPAVERYNLSHLIDREVFQQTLTWLEQRPNVVEQLGRCSINLSGQSMGDNDFVDFLLDLLQNTTIPRNKICIEITETAAVGNMQKAMNLFTQLKELGCMIALDDFGSGLSSFAYLKTLPLDIVKIDGCFVRDMHCNEMDFILVKSINELSKQLGKQTVAEFVENNEILEKLKSLEVDYAQGYLISAPRPLSSLVDDFMSE